MSLEPIRSFEPTRKNAGITLIEVLIAVSLLSLLSVGILMAMRIGFNTMDKTDAHMVQNRKATNARKILEKYKLRVTDIASPLFKVNWPGAPQSPHGPKRDQFHADFDFKQQDKVLERCIDLA